MKTLVEFLERYHAGQFATRESAQFVIRHVTNETDALETLEVAARHPELIEEMRKVVREFKDLTDEQWDKMLTVHIGSWVGTPEQLAELRQAQEIIDKNQHQLLKKGVAILDHIGFN